MSIESAEQPELFSIAPEKYESIDTKDKVSDFIKHLPKIPLEDTREVQWEILGELQNRNVNWDNVEKLEQSMEKEAVPIGFIGVEQYNENQDKDSGINDWKTYCSDFVKHLQDIDDIEQLIEIWSRVGDSLNKKDKSKRNKMGFSGVEK